MKLQVIPIYMTALFLCTLCGCKNQGTPSVVLESRIIESTAAAGTTDLPQNASQTEPIQDDVEAHPHYIAEKGKIDFRYADIQDLEFQTLLATTCAWVTIHEDGSMEGVCDLVLSGENGEDAPLSRVYNSFVGQLENFQQDSPYLVKTCIKNLSLAEVPEVIRVPIKPLENEYGDLNVGDEIQIFLPGAPVSALPESFQRLYLENGEFDDYLFYDVNTEFGFLPVNDKPELHRKVLKAMKQAEMCYLECEKELSANRNLSQADINSIIQQEYEAWDQALNEVWGILKEILPRDKMDALTQVQLHWIAEKEAAAEKAVEEAGGSSMAITAYYVTAQRYTEERLDELSSIILLNLYPER